MFKLKCIRIMGVSNIRFILKLKLKQFTGSINYKQLLQTNTI